MQQKSETAVIIDPAKTALLLLHWQNSLAAPDSKHSGGMPERLAVAHTIENTQAVLRETREMGMLIVYVNACHRPGAPEMAVLNATIAEIFLKGTWGAENIAQLKPLDDEIVVNNYSPSGFCYTELDLILRNKGITGLALSGIATNWIIESTARDGANLGYFIYTLKDCCNSMNDEMHNWPLKNILPALGVVLDSKAYIAALQGHS
ncbi:cysteine hydrolase family protein [Chloroflexota bacterium]